MVKQSSHGGEGEKEVPVSPLSQPTFPKLINTSISGPLKVDHALVQYTSSPVEDRQNIAIFFSRHSSFSNHVHDHVSSSGFF